MSGEENRRRPRNLQGMLQFCLEATKSEDAPENRDLRQLTDEEKAWINGALKEAMGKDPVKIMIEHIQLLSKMGPDDGDEENLEQRQIFALEEIAEYCADLDLAKDFYSIGGYGLLPRLLADDNAELRWRAADLIASLVQNNPPCQAAALEIDLVRTLLHTLNTDTHELTKIKALYALSCLCRECEQGQEELLKHDGLSALVKAIQSNIQKLQTKAAFLMSYLCTTSPKIKGMLTDMGLAEQLVFLLQAPRAAHDEFLVAALHNLLQEDNARAVRECQRPELQLRSQLMQRLDDVRGKPEHMEEEDHCKAILQMCFKDSYEPDK